MNKFTLVEKKGKVLSFLDTLEKDVNTIRIDLGVPL